MSRAVSLVAASEAWLYDQHAANAPLEQLVFVLGLVRRDDDPVRFDRSHDIRKAHAQPA